MVKRRQVLTSILAVSAAALCPHSVRREDHAILSLSESDLEPPMVDPLSDHENRIVQQPISASIVEPLPSSPSVVSTPTSTEQPASPVMEAPSVMPQKEVDKLAQTTKTKVNKNINFAQDYADDIFVSAEDSVVLHSVALRLKKLQSTVGYGHFNILSFDDALRFAKRFNQVGEFTSLEKVFIEKIFTFNARDYGFYGEKVTSTLTAPIKKNATFKVPYTGHYLFKEQSFAYYEKIRKSVGEGIILTSGIRSNVKQLHLFLAKVLRVNGNLSRASRSLAPPGYSYHGIGDFDVGRKGWGGKNFTDAFSQTDEFKRMQDLGYIAIRYDEGNQLGVRFEPWHIQVV